MYLYSMYSSSLLLLLSFAILKMKPCVCRSHTQLFLLASCWCTRMYSNLRGCFSKNLVASYLCAKSMKPNNDSKAKEKILVRVNDASNNRNMSKGVIAPGHCYRTAGEFPVNIGETELHSNGLDRMWSTSGELTNSNG